MMLGQSLSFYSDDFAGRITTKVMQTALAVREMLFTTVEVIISTGVFFRHRAAAGGSFDPRLMLPFLGWLPCTRLRAATSCRGWAASARRRPMRAR
jgi:ATP-binding cassette subfamily B multidrug efflux pump